MEGDDRNKRPSRSTEWRKHGNKKARFESELEDLQAIAQFQAMGQQPDAAQLEQGLAVEHVAAAEDLDAEADEGGLHVGQEPVAAEQHKQEPDFGASTSDLEAETNVHIPVAAEQPNDFHEPHGEEPDLGLDEASTSDLEAEADDGGLHVGHVSVAAEQPNDFHGSEPHEEQLDLSLVAYNSDLGVEADEGGLQPGHVPAAAEQPNDFHGSEPHEEQLDLSLVAYNSDLVVEADEGGLQPGHVPAAAEQPNDFHGSEPHEEQLDLSLVAYNSDLEAEADDGGLHVGHVSVAAEQPNDFHGSEPHEEQLDLSLVASNSDLVVEADEGGLQPGHVPAAAEQPNDFHGSEPHEEQLDLSLVASNSDLVVEADEGGLQPGHVPAAAEQPNDLHGSDSESSSICDMEVHFLEEDPNQPNNININQVLDYDYHDPDDPDDPDDPHVEYSSGEESANSDLENEDQEGFDLFNLARNEPVVMTAIPTVREMLLLDLALMMRHKHTYESLIDTFDSKNVAFGRKHFPTSKKELWRILGRNNAGIVEHVYCSQCGGYIGKKKQQGEFSICPNAQCDFRIETNKAKYFITLSLRCQFKNFLQTPGIADLLKYRENRTKHQEDAIEDVFDSQRYKELNLGPNDFSANMNTDGCKIAKGAKIEIYPVFLRLNELPPLLRQNFMFLGAVYVDTVEPKMTSFLQPLVAQLNSLSEEGVLWNSNGVQVRSKIKVHCMCVDGKARHQVLNMSSHQANYGCTYCTMKGVAVGENHTMRWPALPHPEVPRFEDRTHEGMVEAMVQAHQNHPFSVLGHKGLTPLVLLRDFDLRKANACDDLHTLYECAAKHITEMCLTEAPRVDENMGTDLMCRIIDSRLAKIKTPSNVSRKPGNCSMMNRKQMKGSEWRNWIMYYAVPCLQGLIPQKYIDPVELLSHGAFLLSQDSIQQEHEDEGHRCLLQFIELHEQLYRIDRTRLNLHALMHFRKSVAELGPLWCYSTFNFESWNHNIIQTVSSPKGAILQIVVRHLISSTLELAQHSIENISPRIRFQLSKILKKRRRVNAYQIHEHVYLLGKTIFRNTTEQEQQVLQQLNFNNIAAVQEYKKISINSTVFCPLKHVKNDGKSDNSLVYTRGDTFCSIQSVVRFQTENGVDTCGLFVSEHQVTNRLHFNVAKHISCLLERDNDLPHFIRPQEVRSLAVKMPLHGELYVVPLPNLYEVD